MQHMWCIRSEGKAGVGGGSLVFVPSTCRVGGAISPGGKMTDTQAQWKSGSLVLDAAPLRGWPGGAVTSAFRASLKFS